MAILKILNKKYSINDVDNVVNYILRYDKHPIFKTNLLFAGQNFKTNIIQQINTVITYYNKTSSASNVLHHIIISFDYMNECYISKTDALNIVQKALSILSYNNEHICNYQYILSLHQDSFNYHIHLIINSVCPFTGKMLNVNKTLLYTLQTNLELSMNILKREKKSFNDKKHYPDKEYYYENDILNNNKPATVTIVYE